MSRPLPANYTQNNTTGCCFSSQWADTLECGVAYSTERVFLLKHNLTTIHAAVNTAVNFTRHFYCRFTYQVD